MTHVPETLTRQTSQRQLTEKEGKDSYQESGAKLRPFAAGALGMRHTTQINAQTDSA